MNNIKHQWLQFLCAILLICSLTACKTKIKGDDTSLVPINELYQSGLDLLQREKYKNAAEVFEKMFYQYPGHELTAKAELLQAYSLFQAGSYNEAIDVLENFIVLHPSHQDIEYAYDLRSIIACKRMSYVTHDQSRTITAKSYCEELVNKFPGSKDKDRLNRLEIIDEHLAGKSMTVGRYYFDNNNPIAAIARFKEVIADYSKTSHIPEALYRAIGCYLKLGLVEEAKHTLGILKTKHANTRWYNYANELMLGR